MVMLKDKFTPKFPALFKQPLLQFYISSINNIRPFFTEEVPQVVGSEIPKNEEGPLLWLVQHQSWNDIINLGRAWYEVGSPKLRAMARSDYFPKNPLASALARNLMSGSGVFQIIYREDEREKYSAKKAEEKSQKNKDIMSEMAREFSKGLHGVILPEGTSKTSGRVSEIKSGCYHVARTEIPCISVGNTYDFLSTSSPKKDLVFLKFGEVFQHEPVEGLPNESLEEYTRRDKESFIQKVRRDFIKLNTITTSQLGGLHFYENAANLNSKTSLEELEDSITNRVHKLRALEEVTLDNALLDVDARTKRIRNFYQNLSKLGYFNLEGDEIRMSLGRLLEEPKSLESYRKENPLLFSTNKLLEVAEEFPKIRKALAYFK